LRNRNIEFKIRALFIRALQLINRDDDDVLSLRVFYVPVSSIGEQARRSDPRGLTDFIYLE